MSADGEQTRMASEALLAKRRERKEAKQKEVAASGGTQWIDVNFKVQGGTPLCHAFGFA
jgi:hypothetical protein